MPMSSASTVDAANDENLSLLRMLNPEVLADPHAIYWALREYDPVHWDPYMRGSSRAIRKSSTCSPIARRTGPRRRSISTSLDLHS
jgi:hypothetical protein